MSDAADQPRLRVMAIGAHPDDLELGCFGALCRWRDTADLTLVVATRGTACPNAPRFDRAAEAAASAALLGARLVQLDHPDGELRADRELVSCLAGLIAEHRPNRLLMHDPSDRHQDHRALAEASLTASAHVPQVLTFEAPSSRRFQPSYYVEVSDHLPCKAQAMALHVSQAGKPFAHPDRARVMAESLAHRIGRPGEAYEGFGVIRYLT